MKWGSFSKPDDQLAFECYVGFWKIARENAEFESAIYVMLRTESCVLVLEIVTYGMNDFEE